VAEVPAAIADAYDPERFRAEGKRLVDALADQLAAWHRREGAVLAYQPPAAARETWQLGPLGTGDLVADLARVAAASTALANPRCMGHQVPPPLPGAVLAEMTSAIVNNGMAVYDMGPASVPIELAVVDWMCGKLGLPAGATGVLTSGGSLGNLTALLAMRQARAGFDAWAGGARSGPQLAVVTSNEAHYSVARTVRILGMGDAGVIAAPVDAHHRLTADAIARALATAGERRVIGVIASACSTATGALDPLDDIADLCAEKNLWLHVDAAHGGGLALSPRHAGKLRGIERADSVVWDAHKLLMMPALVTAVLFKRGGDAYAAFAQRASYLFDEPVEPPSGVGHPPALPVGRGAAPVVDTWWDLGQRTLECTKRAMAVELWAALRTHGEAWFGQVIDRQIELAQALAARVTAAADFELALPPEANIVCFRPRKGGDGRGSPPAGSAAEGQCGSIDMRDLRRRVIEDGRFYITGAELSGHYWLRATLMNPLTTFADLDALLEHVRTLCHA
jgi:L-2,4-diaminobutyrate decarboxylase